MTYLEARIAVMEMTSDQALLSESIPQRPLEDRPRYDIFIFNKDGGVVATSPCNLSWQRAVTDIKAQLERGTIHV